MAKPLSLSVHRNGIEARRKRELAGRLSRQIPDLVKGADVRAYAFVALDSEGKSRCLWDTGGIVPLWSFADMVGAMLRRDIEESGVDEDWKPSLSANPITR